MLLAGWTAGRMETPRVCPMWAEEEIVLISAIEHYAYCPRQCGLIHLEQVYEENLFTLKGRQVHERAHEAPSGREETKRVERALPLWSDRLGLYGVADVVEFWDDGTIYPVEYKRSALGRARPAALQLCAQALCLEEMLGVPVPRGALYSHQTRRRREIVLSSSLRQETEATIESIRAMLRDGSLPPPVNDRRCPRCSLVDACAPTAISAARRFVAARLFHLPRDEP